MPSALLKKTLLTAKEILSITIFLIPQFLLGNKNSEKLNYDRTIIFISFELISIYLDFFFCLRKKNILVCRFWDFAFHHSYHAKFVAIIGWSFWSFSGWSKYFLEGFGPRKKHTSVLLGVFFSSFQTCWDFAFSHCVFRLIKAFFFYFVRGKKPNFLLDFPTTSDFASYHSYAC